MASPTVRFTPTCPVCRGLDDVERCRRGWLCGRCWTVFNGSQLEWERTRDLRELYEADHPKEDV
jgi:ribosomal protein L37AE/L43A